ncbi:metallophosphoesterase [Pseudoxanthomonas sacheonensis]|uniref:metallophosphoesterase n=1 Tax=Pseudoxanthomonas sacheonensis TaxID=443615 RepID=UPI0013D0D826|nr:metallophosphoesterase [Pseudoxanthomonas sacheonensis]KAF1708418.1 phosphatase [Pseudoxanthomonas sacheonensis]
MRKTIKWIGIVVGAAIVTLLAFVVFGGFRLKDPQGNVAFGWDSQRDRFQILEKPELALDGPHVFQSAAGFEVGDTVASGEGWRLRTVHVPAQPLPVLTVRVDNAARTSFEVQLRLASAPDDAVVATNPSRLLMVSDMEGEFDKFVALMQSQGVIDGGLHWRFGDGHVALLGDFVDRGGDMVPLLWLIYRLEGEAQRAGGRVHYVLGNHEQLGMAGKTKYWSRHLVATAQALGDGGNERIFSASSVLGAWLRSKPVIARVGDHLLVHGGISRKFLDLQLDIEAANTAARPYLDVERSLLPVAVQPLLGRNGVTWYHGMALPGEKRYAEEEDAVGHLRQVVARYGVKRVAIGHSLVPDVVLEQQGMLLRLDVQHSEQVSQAALYESGRLWRVSADGSRQLLE